MFVRLIFVSVTVHDRIHLRAVPTYTSVWLGASHGDLSPARSKVRATRCERPGTIAIGGTNGRRLQAGNRRRQGSVLLPRPVHVFQSPDHNSANKARESLVGSRGALAARPGGQYVTFYRSLEEAIDTAVSD